MSNKNITELSIEELVDLYDAWSKQKVEAENYLKSIRNEAARRLNEKREQKVIFERDGKVRGFEWASRPTRSVNYDLLRSIINDEMFSQVVNESTVSFVKVVNRKVKEPSTKPIPTIPTASITS